VAGLDSLVIANQFELLGGQPTSANPLCLGAKFMLQPGADPGAPQPTTDFVASLILDGERPFGRRASNRTIKLPIWITAPNRLILAAAREVLQQAIDQDIFTITWTRDPGPGGTPLPLIFDCFRAQPTVPTFNTKTEKQVCAAQIVLTIPAKPYGRSDKQIQMAFAAPLPQAPPAPPAPVVLDNFSTISSPLFFRSNQCVIGPFSAAWDPDDFGDDGGQISQLSYSAAFPAALNLAQMTSLQMYLGLGSRYYPNLEYHGKTSGVAVYVTLTDSNGVTLSFSRSHLLLPVSPVAESPVFSKVSIHIPQNRTSFNYSSVKSYSLTIVNRQDNDNRRFQWVTAYIDALTAYPSTQTATPVIRGSLYTLYDLVGTARAPVTMAFQQAPVAGTPTTITAVGLGNYTVPAGTAYLKVEGIGGGGAGASMTGAGVGGGGGSAEYAAALVFPVTPGQVIPYSIGAGGTSGATPTDGQQTVFGPGPASPLQLVANGGHSALQNSATGGLPGSGSANQVAFPGAQGRTASGGLGGGGASSGGSSSAGATPTGSGTVLFTTPGTNPWTCPAGVFTVFAEGWGSGGGGGSSYTSADNGGGGAGGEYAAAFVPVTPGNVYNAVVPAGGLGNLQTGSGVGGNGASAIFTGDSGNVVTAHGGQGGITDDGSPSRAAGGTGSTNPTRNPGGQGGPDDPYGGGGGSSAGPAAAGNPGGSPNGAVAPAGGGSGGNGSVSGNGSPGIAPGGGGGGVNGSFNGGNGAAGQIRLTFPSGGAPTSLGAPAVTGGGAGGNGGATANTPGSAGSQPGGGGGGANSGGTAEAGGAGGAGQLIVTPYSSLPFKNLIVHRPALGAPKTFQPLVSVGAGADAPDGTHQYPMPQPTTGVNADFNGTYTIYLIASSFSGSGSRTVQVTITQAEYAGGSVYSQTTIPVTFTPSQISNGVVTAGVMTLPIKRVEADNSGGYYTVSVNDSNTSDRYLDCIFLDTMGQSIVVNEPSTGYQTYYADAPEPNASLGAIQGSQNGRPNAISVLDNTFLSGPALSVEPADGDNILFAYSADGTAPNISLSYFPTWYFDRFQ
jgi:hypothetical protein